MQQGREDLPSTVGEPVDRCPYDRPFPEDFAECPAYQPVRYVPVDSVFQPLRPVWSCAHLVVGTYELRAYAKCRLGGPAEREAWARLMQSERLDRWRAFAREFGEALVEPLAAVYAAKGRQVDTIGKPEQDEARRELRRCVEEFLEKDFDLMDARASELEAIGFPVEAMKLVTRDAMEALFRRSRVHGSYEPPAELLADFSAEIADFVRALFASPSR